MFLTYCLCVLDRSEQTVMAGRSDIVDTRSCGTYHHSNLSPDWVDLSNYLLSSAGVISNKI